MHDSLAKYLAQRSNYLIGVPKSSRYSNSFWLVLKDIGKDDTEIRSSRTMSKCLPTIKQIFMSTDNFVRGKN